jgi:hypothetical protein
VSAVQSVALQGSPTGGTFTLAFGGSVSVPIAFNADAATVQAALAALPTIGAGNVVVSGSAGAWVVSFQGVLGTAPVPNLVGVSSLTGGLTPSVAVVTTTTWNYDYGARPGYWPGVMR